MSKAFEKGDRVAWNTPQGKTIGVIQKKLGQPINIKGHHAAASTDHPEYLVRSDKTGAESAHRATALKRLK